MDSPSEHFFYGLSSSTAEPSLSPSGFDFVLFFSCKRQFTKYSDFCRVNFFVFRDLLPCVRLCKLAFGKAVIGLLEVV